MKVILLLAFLCVAQILCAQKITVKGQLIDSSETPLPMATVLFLNPKDSSLMSFGSSNKEGFFEVRNLNKAEYLLKVTYVGHAPFLYTISPKPEESVIDIGVQKLQQQSTVLGAVEIKAEQAPVIIKKDTIEFNAGSFKTQPNAPVEDLLKKLPGVEVDNDGTIRAQGEQVQRVMVDGKEFFGRDPKVATRNLPADAVDKVQIYDKKSDQSLFTGIDDGQREKTINLELKDEKRNQMFGNVTGGYGTDDRFIGKVSLNRFSKNQQLSFVGNANNINEQGFSIDDYMNFTGGSQQIIGGGGGPLRIGGGGAAGGGLGSGITPLGGGQTNGIMSTYGGGVNFNKDFNKKTKFHANYFFNYLDHAILQETERESFTFEPKYYNQSSRQLNTNLNHRLSLILDHEIDSANSFKWTNSFAFNDTKSDQQSETESVNSEGVEVNSSNQTTISKGDAITYNSELLYRHRFDKKGRTFSSNLTFGISDSDRSGTLNGINMYSTRPDESIIQDNNQLTDNLTYGANLSYTEPLGGRKYLEFNYNVRQNENDVKRDVYETKNEERTFSDSLSSQYDSKYFYQRGGFNLRINRDYYSLTIGGGYQYTQLDGNGEIYDNSVEEVVPFTISRTFSNFLPALHFNYDFDNNYRLRMDYETSMQEPTIRQLQPVVDNSNQLNISIGNINLKPSYQHSVRLNFSRFDPVTFISFFSFVNATYTKDAIVNSQSVDAASRTTNMPVNIDNNVNVSANGTLSFPISKWFSRFSLGGNIRTQQNVNASGSVINGEIVNMRETDVNQLTLGGNLRYTFTFKDAFDLSLSTQLSHQRVNYEGGIKDQTFFNKTFTTESNITAVKNYRFSSTFNYTEYFNQSNNSTVSIPMLNFSLSRYLLKARAGELKLSVNNVLDRNLGVSQTATTNYFERQTMNSLGRYYMLTFTYAINRHLNPMGGGRRTVDVKF